MSKVIDYGTKFKFEWAEGKHSETDKYVGKELCLQEFVYIITKRHHEIAMENITNGFYGCYDKHKCKVKYSDSEEWEELGRLDLGNDSDWVEIQKTFRDNFTPDVEFYWSDAVMEGKELWVLRDDFEDEDLKDEERHWLKYEKVRRSGKYNMFTEAVEAMREAGLMQNEYLTVMNNYEKIHGLLVERVGKEKVEELLNK